MLAPYQPSEMQARLAHATALHEELQQIEEGKDDNGKLLAAARERFQNCKNKENECLVARAGIAEAKAQNAEAKAQIAERKNNNQAAQDRLAALRAKALAKKAF